MPAPPNIPQATFQKPQNSLPPTPTSLAPHHVRLFAFMLDGLVVAVVGKLAALAWLPRHWDLRLVQQPQHTPDLAWVVVGLLLFVVRDCLGGRSIGKRVFGLAVVAQSDLQRRPDWLLLLTRNIILVALLPLEVIWVFVDPHYRRLGDKFSQSVVVLHPVSIRLFHRLMGVLSLFFSLLLAAFLLSSWSFKRSAAYAKAVESAQRYAKVLALTGKPIEFAFHTQLQLKSQAQPAQALVGLQAEGPNGLAVIRVGLRLGGGGWQVDFIKAYPSQSEARKDTFGLTPKAAPNKDPRR